MKSVVTILIIFLWTLTGIRDTFSQETEIIYLSGKGYDDAVDWEFYCTEGRNSGKWTTIPVPSCWELQGFGKYNYGHAAEEDRGKEKGLYRYSFEGDPTWKGKTVNIVFEGSMTDTEVMLNGRKVGPVHQGAFYRFSHDVTHLIKPGRENLLEVEVSKHSQNESVNDAERRADYWIFGGIFRPVYLEIRPEESIRRIAVDAKASGQFLADIYLDHPGQANRLEIRLFDLSGDAVQPPQYFDITPGSEKQQIFTRFNGIRPWSPEFPQLYEIEILLEQDDQIKHRVRERIGFRTVEVRERDGIYVNGQKIRLKGVCRHSFWPETGRTTSKSLSIQDVRLMKEMNMNAVRMSHYPPDVHFLEACDSLGLFVLDELAGWQAAYDTGVGKKLVMEMVIRDVNYPSVVIWDNGNEGGWNTDLDDEFIKYDPQQREVIHPQEKFRKTDTNHYIDYNYGTHDAFNGTHIFFPTEFLHGLYDGGHGAGLEDFWNLMLDRPRSAGGFLWVFSDEAVVRTDMNGKLDADGNHAPDGILGPHREKEGSYYTIREIWSPVFIEDRLITENFDGKFMVENRYHFTNLNQCNFTYKIVKFPAPANLSAGNQVVASGKVQVPSIEPGDKGVIWFDLPEIWEQGDVLFITGYDPYKMEILTWDWAITLPVEFVRTRISPESPDRAAYEENEKNVVLYGNNIQAVIEKNSGILQEISSAGEIIPFSNGPELTGGEAEFKNFSVFQEGQNAIYVAYYTGNIEQIRWTMSGNGLLRLEFIYFPTNHQPFFGINFDFPETDIKKISWLGKGPYRVWKNRLKGNQLNTWEKDYNNTITGETYEYPEFKGYFASLYWANFTTRGRPFTVYCATEDVYLRLFTPEQPEADPRYTEVTFPEGEISFLNGINAIGTKFKATESLGPQSQLNMYQRQATDRNINLELLFDFR
ncbi:MAG: glycoside hydrolase family 2 [Cyclobacteriaceae bacterium]|nr:glycoside hydrolase family 2 [Cyclobacteriaceae bacterium]